MPDGNWSLTLTPPSAYEYADTIKIPQIHIENGDDFDFGVIQFNFQAPPEANDLESFSLPSECSLAEGPDPKPKIFRIYYEDEKKGSFLFVGNTANIIVVADDPNYEVKADYSLVETNQFPTNPFDNSYTVSATYIGNGKYKATHKVTYNQEGDGLVIIRVKNTTTGAITYGCSQPEPVNLDIRNFFTGSDTTNFLALGADPNTDFRKLTNFTMHQDGVVKVVFTKQLNMLDPTVQRFMISLANKMVTKKAC
ncbi:MAG: hypothetical protein KatS3mg090_0522 [Patescibacteria group bacterium]|nr:MAG: hypothetical protein KatS3mg090_0522 [Patescibacteria group bacterium]